MKTHHTQLNAEPRQEGFIAMVSVLIIGALVLMLSVGASMRGVGDISMSIAQQHSARALSLSNTCAETALMKLKNTLRYQGNESILFGGESCMIYPVEGTGNLNRIVKTSSTVSGHTKKVIVTVSRISPVMQIALWREVSDL